MTPKIRATFIGTNNSLGYKTGKEYELRITGLPPMGIIRADGSGGICHYQSLRSFLLNWDNIHVIENNFTKMNTPIITTERQNNV